ncbi:MAG TPA: hypothetical protein VH592_18960 [Gemmataceae bacterium]|jgi:hypothetical protein
MTGWFKGRLLEGGWLLFWIIASSIWCVSASARLSATFDEPTYISLGLESWRTGSYKPLIDLGTMPLPPLVQTLPLHFWERWRGENFNPPRDLDRLLPIARLATLPFWWLLLIYGWLAGRQMAGVWGGRLALAFLACEPNLLAHASLATTDVAVTACLVALLFHFRAGRGQPWWRRVLIPAAWFAVAVLAKASGFVFGIIGLGIVELEHQWANIAEGTTRSARVRLAAASLFGKSFRRDLWQICSLGLLAVFCFCGSEGLPSPSFIEWARQLPEGPLRSGMTWFAEHLCIFSNAGVALIRQVRHNVQGHGVFLLQHVARRAIWCYFPLALSIKSPLPVLVLPLLLAMACRRSLRNWACFTALALLLFTLICRVQTGIRLVLPLVSLAVIGIAAALVTARQHLGLSRWRPLLTASSALSAAWLLWTSLSVWPHGLCYTNELWGGTTNGYRCLSDSNYDWGQGLSELAQWQAAHHVDDLHVMYYGTDTKLATLPVSWYVPGGLQLDADDLPAPARGHIFAVGTSIVYGSVSEIFPDLKALAKKLRGMEPADRTMTFLIYHLPPDEKIVSAEKGQQRIGGAKTPQDTPATALASGPPDK